ncbi:DUF6114 domain-containing protein [Streptomyces caelestis]|uniref:DUF6114 domain-containing protein n=1 Tax=Streptomyces caelestis TaxID=36816 RepID=UPI00382E6FE7
MALPSLLISSLLVALGLSMWFQAAVRVFAGTGAVVLTMASLVLPVVSNLVIFLVAHLPGLIGGALAVAWDPGAPAADPGAQPAEPSGGSDKCERQQGLPERTV